MHMRIKKTKTHIVWFLENSYSQDGLLMIIFNLSERTGGDSSVTVNN